MAHSITDTLTAIHESSVEKNLARPYLTKYEFNQIIGLRTMHLSKGAIPLVDVSPELTIKGNMDLRQIALQEIKEAKLPYIVKRKMPNGKIEYWKLVDLKLTAVRHLLR
jgi:DNA-directed RNA polymerase subunit K/omega